MSVTKFGSLFGRKVQRTLIPLFMTTVSSYENRTASVPNVNFQITRNVSYLEITKNIEIISKNKIETKVQNLKLTDPPHKPMVVLISWLLAKKKYVLKYANFYLDQDFDVLNIACTPWHFLWPAKGIQLIADDLLNFLDVNNTYHPLLLHGFSVGGYFWGEVLVRVLQDQKRYQKILDRIVGQIWDSAVDVTEIAKGVPKAIFPHNRVMEKALQQYMIYHLRAFDKVATSHYVRASQMFHTNMVKSPALFFISNADPIGTVEANLRVRDNWNSMGIETYTKCFDKSAHVGHFQKYPEEYLFEWRKFMQRLNLDQNRKDNQQIQRAM